MSTYAADTSVSVEKSRAEIEAILVRYGAERFAYMMGDAEAVIGFSANGKFVKFTLPLPNRGERRFQSRRYTRMGRFVKDVPLSPEQSRREYEQACRSRWRSLALCVKAKLEAVAAGITTFEAEFMAHIVVPDGRTLGQHLLPQLEEMQRSGTMPKMMLTIGGGT